MRLVLASSLLLATWLCLTAAASDGGLAPSDSADAGTGTNSTEMTRWLDGCPHCGNGGCKVCCPVDFACPSPAGVVAGADFLLVRSNFSESYAYVRVTDRFNPGFVRTADAVDTEFSYEASFRLFAGYRLPDSASEFRFTYWHFDTDATERGRVNRANQFLVDPLGDEGDDIGDTITADTDVDLDVYDFEFISALTTTAPRWGLKWSAGVRIADLEQFYESRLVDNGGGLEARTTFSADFLGAGPRVGVEARRYLGEDFSLFVKGNGTLLVGEYESTAGAVTGPIAGRQVVSLTRTVPVAEIELGAACRLADRLSISAGWLFQAWWDLGASGGTFGGNYVATDDSNIMSFDGLFLRAELTF